MHTSTREMQGWKIGLIDLFARIGKMNMGSQIKKIAKKYFAERNCELINQQGELHILLVAMIFKTLIKGEKINCAEQICSICKKTSCKYAAS